MLFFIRCLSLICVLLFFGLGSVLAGPVVLFDEAHNQQFLAGGDGSLDLSAMAEELVQAGAVVKTSAEPLTEEVLEGVDVLVISGAFAPLSAAEIDQVMSYLESGGGLAVMLHIAPPLDALLLRLEVDFANGSLRELRNVIGDNPLNFRLMDLEKHPLTDGLESFSVYGAWALRGTAEQVKVLARTSDHAWIDLDRSGQLSSGDASQVFGVLLAGEVGQGRFAVFGDDAMFQNSFIDENNRKLARNLINWLGQE